MFKATDVNFVHDKPLNGRDGTTREFYAGEGDERIHGRIAYDGIFTGDGWRPGEALPPRWLDVQIEDKPHLNPDKFGQHHSEGTFTGEGHELVRVMTDEPVSVLRLAGIVEPVEHTIVRLPSQVAQLELPVPV